MNGEAPMLLLLGNPTRPPAAPLAVACLALTTLAAIGRAEEAPSPPKPPIGPTPTLILANGGFATGELADSDEAGSIRWKAPGFDGPLEFAARRIVAVRWPSPAKPVEAEGPFRFELAGGDVVFGSIVALDEATAEIEAAGLGRLHVDRSALRRLQRRASGSGTVYAGPDGLAGWSEPSPKDSWRDESGRPTTDLEGSTLRGDLGLPDRAVVEFDLSWKKKPDFVLAFGVGPDEKDLKRAFRFEVWDGELVVTREVNDRADLASLGKLADGAGRVHLIAYIDQGPGRIVVASPDGRPMADLTVAAPEGQTRAVGGVALVNLRGDCQLESLRIGRWDGTAPRAVEADRSRVHGSDGSITYGRVKGYDASTREFLIRDGDSESRLAESKVAEVFLSSPDEVAPRSAIVSTTDGTRLGGTIGKVGGGSVELTVAGLRETPRLPLAGLRSIAFAGSAAAKPEKEGRPGILVLDGAWLPGRLVAATAGGDANGLLWEPVGGRPVPIGPKASGRIVYADPKPPASVTATGSFMPMMAAQPLGGAAAAARLQAAPAPVVRDNIVIQKKAVGVVIPAPAAVAVDNGVVQKRAVVVAPPAAVPPAPPAPMVVAPAPGIVQRMVVFNPDGTRLSQPARPRVDFRRVLHLRAGDVIPCDVTSIDEAGIHFKSSMTSATFVPHARIKAVDMAPLAIDSIKVGKDKRERLLTLPRMQKGSPPTQLIRSTNGDFLRGRVLAMDEKTLEVEARLDAKSVPRDRVARIIWFHPDEAEKAKTPPPNAPSPAPVVDGPLRVQAVRNAGDRLTFHPEALVGDVLKGQSDLLGPCQVKVSEVDQLLIGGAIEQAASQLAYANWFLRDAEEPRYIKDDGSGGPDGTLSPMVGQPAPDFTLEMLDGGKFHLADTKGKVVILDFWATWCGPCVQSMPQVDRVAREFKDRGVQLIAVNEQEGPREIRAMLDRHQLAMPVGLDRTGSVGEKYAANAFPQTVIIDRDGKVARVYVGAGPAHEAMLRDALNALPGMTPPK